MADFGESFLNAMQTGLSVARSYRDEARLNEQIKRQNRRDDLAEKLALSAEDRAAKLFGQQTETHEYTKNKLRPLQEKSLQLGLEGQEISNNAAKIDLQYKPEVIQTGLAAQRANIGQSNASAAYTGVLARNARIQGEIQQMTLDQLKNDTATHAFISSVLNGGDVSKAGPRFEASFLQFTGLSQAAARTRDVLGQVSRGDFSWVNDKGARESIQTFLRPEAQRSARQRGLSAGTADVAGFAPAKGGVSVTYSAVRPDGKGVEVWRELIPADRLFAKVDIVGGAAQAFRSNPNAANSALQYYQSVNPKGYAQIIAAAQESIDDKIESFRSAAGKTSDQMQKRQFTQQADALEARKGEAVTQQALSYFGIVGNKIGSKGSANYAITRVRNLNPNMSSEEAASRVNQIVQEVDSWQQNGTLGRLLRGGVIPGNKAPRSLDDYVLAYTSAMRDPKGRKIITGR